ncbi:MAG: adenylosuccinate lyase [Methanomassiliicoccales archaeon]|nr:adenylosuccinate lyase [Methanomassiliicoccales archaeon]
MLLCPLDYRYGRDEMKAVFSEETKFRTQLLVEAALARAHASVGNISKKDAAVIASKADLKHVKLERVKEIEKKNKHDVMAMVKALSEECGTAGKYVHLGATSNDIIDTATAIQMSIAFDILEDDVLRIINTFADMAKRHRRTVMVGRTHGQFAVPTTFGFKIAGYLTEMMRYLERLSEARKRVCVGKMSGAVGTGAAFGAKAHSIQEAVMTELGLGVEKAATQIVCRDRYAEIVSLLAQLCTSCERYATEVRNLQRSEVQEVSEAFDYKNQVGSSTMAQKKNPIASENVCGLARIVRAFVAPSMENMVLWHERDLTNSSAERFILPHVFALSDDILAKTEEIFSHLVIRPEKMKENLEKSQGMVMAESVMMTLVEQGMGRQEAHELVRKVSLKGETEGKPLFDLLAFSKEVKAVLSKTELAKAMDPESYIGTAPRIVDEVVADAKRLVEARS